MKTSPLPRKQFDNSANARRKGMPVKAADNGTNQRKKKSIAMKLVKNSAYSGNK